MNESLPWLPKEIKHRQLPGNSNKVSHFVFQDALWQVTSAEDKDMKQKHGDSETVCVCVGGVGVRVDRCQRLNPECGKGRGIDPSSFHFFSDIESEFLFSFFLDLMFCSIICAAMEIKKEGQTESRSTF